MSIVRIMIELNVSVLGLVVMMVSEWKWMSVMVSVMMKMLSID